jgi:hypothetical protein
MESTGVPEHVQISSTTYAKVKDAYQVTPREVPVKGLGMVKSYLIETAESAHSSKH